MTREPEPWERSLREELDALAKAVDDEQPPDLGALLMLVRDVQRAQREAIGTDLLRFLAVAALALCAWLWASLQFPILFLAAQAVLAVAMAAGGALAHAGRRRMGHE